MENSSTISYRKMMYVVNLYVCSRLEGKVAIITGGANGIGEATASLFVNNGAKVVIADIQDEKGTQLAKDLGLHAAVFKHCDVSLESDVEDLVAFTIQTWGKLDIMFNNAGVLGSGSYDVDVRGMSMIDFDTVMSINVRGMALGVKHASKAMVKANNKGSIICTGSVSSILGSVGIPTVYTISKHATMGLVRAAACELGKYGIRVNCVSPTIIPTRLVMNYLQKVVHITQEEAQSYFDSKNNLAQHSLACSDVAKAVVYLASDDAAFVSGINHIVDGGFSCGRNLLEKEDMCIE